MNSSKPLAVLLIIVLGGAAVYAFQGPSESSSDESAVPAIIESAPASITSEPANAEAADTIYTLVSEVSTLEWEASRLGSNPHVGTVDISQGTLLAEDGEFIGGSFTIDMTTITDESNNERLISHISNEDFFNVPAFPSSTFTITSLQESSAGAYTVSGDLTILGITKRISFPSEMTTTDEGINATAEFQIDRTEWGITYDSGSFFQQLGDRAIKDEIDYRLDLSFKKA